MKVLVFDLVGLMANFRVFYANKTALSYAFPPRTVLMGVVGAILGYPRDSYYDLLSPERARFSVALLTPVRKTIQGITYLRTNFDSPGLRNLLSTAYGLRNKAEGRPSYQTSLELVIPEEGTELRYRVYFSQTEEGSFEDYDRLKRMLEEGRTYYSVYFGMSEFLADVEYVGEFEEGEPLKDRGVKSVVPETFFDRIDFEGDREIYMERTPFTFEMDEGFRKTVGSRVYAYERNGKEIPLKSYEGVVSVNGENVIWMEDGWRR